ncbi:hypothetical protein DESUT3_33890 [Desulfuromonas versatilis]|uniref:Uncharacterized protein n=1 Tax=Desulfuromonas versatilis TaxID=2802975 RepID=A0ABN6E1Y3_9BACT|nr:hypothetical protein [Desulfuromonas versatilis]BCR06320.1 hypothetical protein DESUT3_33890 [Desulfuromonas versatilis]
MNTVIKDEDVVPRLISHCLKDHGEAERLFQALITDKQNEIDLPEGKLHLTKAQLDEFVERYSSEVGPVLWESKRAKT